MSHVTLDEINEQTDAMDSEHFQMLFGSIPGSSDTRPLSINCQTAVIPGITVEPIEVALHGHTVRFRGKQTFSGTFSIGFVENSAYEIQRRLRAWKESVVGTNTATSQGYKNQYAVTCELQVFDTTGVVADQLKIFGVFPSEVPEVQLDGQSSQVMLIQPTFSFDYFTSIHHDYR